MGPLVGLPPPPSFEYQQITHREFSRGTNRRDLFGRREHGASAGPTTAAVTVTETIPAGLSLTSMAGIGWICSSNTCTRSDTLNGAVSFQPITVTVNVTASTATTERIRSASQAEDRLQPTPAIRQPLSRCQLALSVSIRSARRQPEAAEEPQWR